MEGRKNARGRTGEVRDRETDAIAKDKDIELACGRQCRFLLLEYQMRVEVRLLRRSDTRRFAYLTKGYVSFIPSHIDHRAQVLLPILRLEFGLEGVVGPLGGRRGIFLAAPHYRQWIEVEYLVLSLLFT
jgi:hypothetical protein